MDCFKLSSTSIKNLKFHIKWLKSIKIGVLQLIIHVSRLGQHTRETKGYFQITLSLCYCDI